VLTSKFVLGLTWTYFEIRFLAKRQNGGGNDRTTKSMKHIITCVLLLMNLMCFGATTKVTRVIDGDTFETETGEKVRLIGINAPEISDIYGYEAKQHLTDLINGKIINLEIDNISNDRDRYSRLLRYVILDGKDINKLMISDGFAFAYLKYNFEKSSVYKQAQLLATQNNKGIWGNGNNAIETEQQLVKENDSRLSFTKEFFIISIVALLLLLGFYYYFKK
jgi:micrococcal nuclease